MITPAVTRTGMPHCRGVRSELAVAVSGVAAVIVRTASTDELAAAGACVRAAYEADGLGSPSYLTVVADARARARTADVLVAVAASGEVVGSVTFVLPGSPWSELSRPGEAEFRMLGVLPPARGGGVASALVEACLTRAAEHGARRVVICSQVAMTAAHRLYGRFGFVRAPELDRSPDSDTLLLGFALDLTGRTLVSGRPEGWSAT